MAKTPLFSISIKLFLLGLVLMAFPVMRAFAQDSSGELPPPEYARGKVLEILTETPQVADGLDDAEQSVMVEIRSGSHAGQQVTLSYGLSAANFESQKLHKNDRIIVSIVGDGEDEQIYILDSYRLPWMLILTVGFALLACVLGRKQGLGAIIGLGASLAVIMTIIVPWIIHGGNPLLASFVGSLIICIVSMLLAHGFNRRTAVALAATLLTLIVATVLSLLAVHLVGLSGAGTEEAIYLQIDYLSNLNLQGLLLGAIVIGTLGVLDDVTTAQVAAVEEIHGADSTLVGKELYKRGSSVGREHIASLVNTLLLAYVGASFPLFLLFVLPGHAPLWVIINGENIMEEIIRSLVGGASLMLAVPISTALAAMVFGKRHSV